MGQDFDLLAPIEGNDNGGVSKSATTLAAAPVEVLADNPERN